MKLSLKFRGNDDDGDQNSTQTQIMTAKVPITVFNQPFMSIIKSTTNTNTNTNTSDFSFSLSTNFPTGPNLKLSYSPSTSSLPFSLSLKSGLSIFGSPHNSPLIFSAKFPLSLSTTTHTPPSFFLHFKPQFGHFSLNKTVFSDNTTNPLPPSLPLDNPQIEKGFESLPYGSSSGWQNLILEPYGTIENNIINNNVVVPERKNNEKCGPSPGVAIMARTVIPVTQGLLLNFRWGVNFLGKSGMKMPYLTVNKIGLERVVEVKQNELQNTDDKGMLFGMRRELESVEKENREMKRMLNEMKREVSNSNSSSITREGKSNEKVGNKQKSFQHWENNKGNGKQENEKKVKQPNQNKPQPQPQSVVVVSDLESELQKAIKAASSS